MMSLKASTAATILVVCLGVVNSQFTTNGTCPTGQTFKENFEPEKYLGNWFEIEKYPSDFQNNLKCAHAVYSVKSFGIIGVNNTGTHVTDNTVAASVGLAYAPDPVNAPAKLLVSFPPRNGQGQYWVMDTDYTGYAVVYACSSNETHKTEFAWVLSRASTLNDAAKETVRGVLQKNNIDSTRLVATSQEGCQNHPNPTNSPNPTSPANGSGRLTIATGLLFAAVASLLA